MILAMKMILIQGENRLKLAYKYSRLCKLISKQGATVVIATISLFKEIHEGIGQRSKDMLKYF